MWQWSHRHFLLFLGKHLFEGVTLMTDLGQKSEFHACVYWGIDLYRPKGYIGKKL